MSAVDTLRDALYGNPPSPNWLPSREGTLKAFSEISEQVQAAVAGIVYYASGAARAADTSKPVGTIGKAADETDYYRREGDGWVIDNSIAQGLADVVQPIIDDGAAELGAISAQVDAAATRAEAAAGSAGSSAARFNEIAYLSPVTLDPYRAADVGFGSGANQLLWGRTFGEMGYSEGILIDRITVARKTAAAGAKIGLMTKVGTKYAYASTPVTADLPAGVTVLTAPADFTAFVAAADQTISAYHSSGGWSLDAGNAGDLLAFGTENVSTTPETPDSLAYRLMLSVEGRAGGIVEAVSSLKDQSYSRVADVGFRSAAASGSNDTSNATLLLRQTFGEACPPRKRMRLRKVVIFAKNAVSTAVFKILQRPGGVSGSQASWVRDIFSAPLVAGRNEFVAGVDFNPLPVDADQTLAVYGKEAGIYRGFGHDGLSNLPYFVGNFTGQNGTLSALDDYVMMYAEVEYEPLKDSQPSKYLYFSFVETDTGGTASDQQGYAVVYRGDTPDTFTENLPVTVVGKPTDHSIRDLSVRVDETGAMWGLASAHNVTVGAGYDNCDLYRITLADSAITMTYVTSINSGLAGSGGMWAPEWLPDEGAAAFIVSCVMPDATHGVVRVPHIYRATNPQMTAWTHEAQVTGDAFPYDAIDHTVVKINGLYLLCGTNIVDVYSSSAEQGMFLAVSENRAGPYATRSAYPLLGDKHCEGAQFARWGSLPAGVLRMYYDSHIGIGPGLRYSDTSDLGATWTTPAPVYVGIFTNKSGQLVRFPPRHGCIVAQP